MKWEPILIKYFFSYFRPDTIYSIRVQAVNSVGCGAFSSNARLSTRPLPPAPPRCECVNANHNSLKLKWGDSEIFFFFTFSYEGLLPRCYLVSTSFNQTSFLRCSNLVHHFFVSGVNLPFNLVNKNLVITRRWHRVLSNLVQTSSNETFLGLNTSRGRKFFPLAAHERIGLLKTSVP